MQNSKCSNCGRLLEPSEKKRCPHCKAKLEGDLRTGGGIALALGVLIFSLFGGGKGKEDA